MSQGASSDDDKVTDEVSSTQVMSWEQDNHVFGGGGGMCPSEIAGLIAILQVYSIQEDDLDTSSEVMEMDELNQNECMASLIDVINHLIKNKISPQPKQVNFDGQPSIFWQSNIYHVASVTQSGILLLLDL